MKRGGVRSRIGRSKRNTKAPQVAQGGSREHHASGTRDGEHGQPLEGNSRSHTVFHVRRVKKTEGGAERTGRKASYDKHSLSGGGKRCNSILRNFQNGGCDVRKARERDRPKPLHPAGESVWSPLQEALTATTFTQPQTAKLRASKQSRWYRLSGRRSIDADDKSKGW